MKGVLKIGRISGIDLELHWTFSLLVLWVVYLDLSRGGNVGSAVMNVLIIVILFGCVILHELGHALTAKRFDIETKKIMLLPIGGVASLEKMPENPRQELLVAIAGPLVNVGIAVLLLLFFPIQPYLEMDKMALEELFKTPGPEALLLYVFTANIMLVAFNLIPAFPMDGGRVFRAFLSFWIDRVKATHIAARLGQFLAVVFIFVGFASNPFLVFIGLFIFMGAYGEYEAVKSGVQMKGHYIHEAMLRTITIFHPDTRLEEVIDTIIAGTEKDFVVAVEGRAVGILYNKDIIANAKNPALKVGDIMKTAFVTISRDKELKEFITYLSTYKQSFFPVVTKDGLIVGAIDMNNVSEFLLLKVPL